MPCRSQPAPGSVIAIAVISSPRAEAGQPALLLLVGGQLAQVRARRRRCAGRSRRRWRRPGSSPRRARRCSGSRAPRRRRTAPVARPCRAGPAAPASSHTLAVDDAGLLPLGVERRDVLLRPGADHVAELVVVGVVQMLLHAAPPAWTRRPGAAGVPRACHCAQTAVGVRRRFDHGRTCRPGHRDRRAEVGHRDPGVDRLARDTDRRVHRGEPALAVDGRLERHRPERRRRRCGAGRAGAQRRLRTGPACPCTAPGRSSAPR